MLADRLRKSVLQAAMEGKLTERLSSDKDITSFVKESELKRVDEKERYWMIPENWGWIKFSDLVDFKIGKTPVRSNQSFWGNDIPWISIADMKNQPFIKHTKEKVSNEGFFVFFKNEIIPKGTLIMSFKLTVGRVSILNIDALHNEAIISIFPKKHENIQKKYLFYILPYISNLGDTKDAIKGKTLNSKSLSNLLIPLPPIEEQVRIVERLEIILPILYKLEEDETNINELEKQIPDKIKKSILKNALYGNLTKQNLSDESVDAFIREVNPLFKKKNIVESKYYPYEIPENWRWIYLGDLIPNIFSNKSPKYSKVANENFILGQRNNQDYGIDLANIKYGTDEFWSSNNKELFLQKGDVLLNTLGAGTIGRSGIFELDGNYLTDGHLFVFRTNNIILQKYLLYYLKFNRSEIERNAAGSTNQIFLRLRDVKQYLFPLPPFEEMKRIVENLEKLFRTELLR